MNILVTGGAGYIGSHAVRVLDAAGHKVTVFDNLSRGHRGAVRPDQLVVGDIADRAQVEQTLRERRIDAVMHFAAHSQVGESVVNPALYYDNNIGGTISLLEAMRAADVKRMVFSSTTATYGQPERMPISEDEPQKPINPYGFSKLVIEEALADYANAYGFAYAALRYFNAAGASPDGEIGEDHTPETHLIPVVLQFVLGQRPALTVFGDDYPTPDGTCIRDYVHVMDLADAHLRALERLEPGQGIELNLGTGRGFSVAQVIETCRQVTGHKIPAGVGERRAGDPAELVADARRARHVLGWEPQYAELRPIVETAWRWHKSHPQGYGKS